MKKHIEYLKAFIVLWDNTNDSVLSHLSIVYRVWCTENNFPQISADDLLHEILEGKHN